MAREELRNCPTCGERVPEGKTRCPNGHQCVWSFPDTETDVGLDIASAELDLAGMSPEFIFECYRCRRLVETQFYHGTVIEPRFCPWCGKPVSSIRGRELDGYRIDEIISRGGFGIVYLASNITQPSMKSVVKILRPQISNFRPDFIKLFVEEARLTEAIGQTCWNIVRVSNVREEPWPYFFMEYIRGNTLEEFIAESSPGKLPIPDCVGYLHGIAKALAATHARGRVHRDLKPVNIMVIKSKGISQAEERIKMIDLGLAMKIASKGETENLSDFLGEHSTDFTPSEDSPVQSAGTPEYMAPEAFEGVADFEEDIYSFGVTAYEVLTGARPWKDPPPSSDRLTYWKNCHQKESPTPIRELRPEAPKWLARVVMDCLEKQADKRIGTAEELLRRLRAPLPRRVWAAAAAVIVLLVFLAVRGAGGTQGSVVRWLDRGGELNARTLLVSGADDLATREVRAVLQIDGRDLEWEAPGHEGVEISPDDADGRMVRVRFPASAALLDQRVLIEGSSWGLFGSDVIVGEIEIRQDDTAPRIEPGFRLRIGREERAMPASRRLGREVELLAGIDEENPLREVFFHAAIESGERTGTTFSIDGEPDSEREGVWAFSLGKLFEEGNYRGWVQAIDLAGNTSATPPEEERLAFTLDDTVEFESLSNLPADGKWLIEFKVEEEIREVFFFKGASTRDGRPPEIYPSAGGARSSLTLSRSLEQGELEAVPLAEVRPSPHRYYLCVPVQPGEDLEVVTVRVADGAAPPNEVHKKIELTSLRPLGAGDIREISIKLNNDRRVVGKEFLYAEGTKPGDAARLPSSSGGTEEVFVDDLSFTLPLGRVLFASCAHAGSRLLGTVYENSVVFKKLVLTANERNELQLTFGDPLRRTLSMTLVLLPDNRVPDLDIVVRDSKGRTGSDRTYFDVATGDDLALEVRSASDLRSVTIATRGRPGEQALERRRSPAGGRDVFVLSDLGAFDLSDGSYDLEIKVTDRLDREFLERRSVVLNSSSPEVTLVGEKQTEPWRLGARDRVVLQAKDPNGIDWERATFEVEVGGKRERLDMERDPKASNATTVTFSIDLKALPERCAGTLLPRIPDVHGRTDPDQSKRFEWDRQDWKDELVWGEPIKITWVKISDGGLYISRCEVSNELFDHPRFIGERGYRHRKLRGKPYRRPRFWPPSGRLPRYKVGGEIVPGDEFPVVGVSPDEAEAFAATIGGRLPTWDEWLAAGRLGYPGGKYPWRDAKLGKNWFNYYRSWERPASTLRGKHSEMMYSDRKKHPSLYYVKVDEDPFPEDVATGNRSCRILHQLGNVAEIVRWKKRDGKVLYGIVGGDFEGSYDTIDLENDPVPYKNDEESRNFTTGFRIVMDVNEAPPGFREEARK